MQQRNLEESAVIRPSFETTQSCEDCSLPEKSVSSGNRSEYVTEELFEIPLETDCSHAAASPENQAGAIDTPQTNAVSYSNFLTAFQGTLLTDRDQLPARHRRYSSSDGGCSDLSCSIDNDERYFRHMHELKQSIAESLRQTSATDRSLPIFGPEPCTVRCPDCREDVHTKTEFTSHQLLPVLRAVSAFLSCCGSPPWLGKLRVHQCPHCARDLGRVTS